MREWTAQTWISLGSAIVSVIGAAITIYWTRRRMIWDAGRELGALRRDALHLISYAMNLSHQTWSVGVRMFQSERSAWEARVLEKQPLMSTRGHEIMEELGTALYAAEREIFGLWRVHTDDPAEDPQPDGDMAAETWDTIVKIKRRLEDDPHLLTK